MIGSESLWARLFKKKPDPFLPSEEDQQRMLRRHLRDSALYQAGLEEGRRAKSAETCSDIDASSRVIQALAEAGGAVRSNDELADLLGARKGTVSKWITKLEADGKVRRHRDGRQVRIRLVA